jgi:ATP-binding cassette subfamily B protein
MKRKKSNNKVDFKYNFKNYWSFIGKHKILFFTLFFFVLIVEGLLIVDKFLFKIIIDEGTKFVEGTLLQSAFIQILMVILLVFIGISISRTIFKWLIVNLSAKLDSNVIFNLKRRYFNHIVKLSHRFHTGHKTGSLISRLGRGTGAVEQMTDTLVFQFAPFLFNILLVGFSLAQFSLIPALVIFGISIVFVLYSFYIQQLQQVAKLKYNDNEDREKGFIGDVFTNVDSIKYFGKENFISRKFAALSNRTKKSALKYWHYFRWFDAGQTFILSLGTFLLIYFPLKEFLAGTLTLGTLVFIYTIYGNVIGPMFGFVWGIRGFYRSMADFQKLFEYGKIENDIKDKENAPKLKINKGHVEFRNIKFFYGKNRNFSFDNFNLKINKNEKVALVGHSGCGKTTLIKLLYRFYDVVGGEILIDEKNIKNFNQESVRSELSIVPQETILFDDTLFNNIKFSNPSASRKEVLEAIKLAQLDKFVNNLPKKEQTIVGERGVKLSGGEKQRVSIARAILANKKILVLDEATSALDSETESEIQKSLENLLEGRTSIIIAHRLSTIMNADRIIVMKDGKIIQQGNHRTLIKKQGEYRRLWNLQKGGYIN